MNNKVTSDEVVALNNKITPEDDTVLPNQDFLLLTNNVISEPDEQGTSVDGFHDLYQLSVLSNLATLEPKSLMHNSYESLPLSINFSELLNVNDHNEGVCNHTGHDGNKNQPQQSKNVDDVMQHQEPLSPNNKLPPDQCIIAHNG